MESSNRRSQIVTGALIAGSLAIMLGFAACSATNGATGTQGAGAVATQQSLAADGRLNYLVVVNKDTKLPDDWEETVSLVEAPNPMGENGSGPIPIEEETYDAFLELQKDLLENDGVDIELDSCYRSVAKQQEIWDDFTEQYGEDYVKTHVAVPGYSEHHTGLAVDLYLVIDGKDVYENEEMMTHQDIWDKVHAKLADYGFILHYAQDKVDVTGYDYEPWHIRYVGSPEVAHAMVDAGLTLEEYMLVA